MKAVVRSIPFPESGRLLAVSDVHGNLPWLKGLLEKVGFSAGDALVLVGDLVEKGPDSLATLRYVMELSKTHTVHALCGNCDNLAVDFMDGNSGLGRDFFRYYLSVWKERSLITQMAMEIGAPVSSPEDLPALRGALRERFAPELNFLRTLPTILTAPNYVFVHGGVPSYDHMEELDAWKCMKNDDFMGQGYSFPYYCVVGHWPVSLYRPHRPCCAPLIDRQPTPSSSLPPARRSTGVPMTTSPAKGPWTPNRRPTTPLPSAGATTPWRYSSGEPSSPCAGI